MILSYLQCVALIFWALEYWRMDTVRPQKKQSVENTAPKPTSLTNGPTNRQINSAINGQGFVWCHWRESKEKEKWQP